MPQTIALQRGSGSWISSFTGNSYTLFTQSTGIATRVIPVQLVVNRTDGGYTSTPASAQLALTLTASGAGTSVLAAAYSSTSIGLITNSFGWPLATNTLIGNSAGPNTSAYFYSGLTNTFAVNNNLYPELPANKSAILSAVPQFWMGPGDSIAFRVYATYYDPSVGQANAFGTYSYSFVTITES